MPPPKLGARVRLLAARDVNKNDPNDARSVAVAALHSPGVAEVKPDDHAAVLKIWSKRHRDLGRARTQVVCRLHAVLCDLVPGGVSKPIYASHGAAFLEDLRRIDAQIRETRKKLAAAVQATGTSLTGLFGVGPVIAAAVIGDVRDMSRFEPATRCLEGPAGGSRDVAWYGSTRHLAAVIVAESRRMSRGACLHWLTYWLTKT